MSGFLKLWTDLLEKSIATVVNYSCQLNAFLRLDYRNLEGLSISNRQEYKDEQNSDRVPEVEVHEG